MGYAGAYSYGQTRSQGAYVFKDLDLSDERQVLEILSLQEASYAVEAELIGSFDIPPLKDTADTLRRCGETFCGFFAEGRLVGAISYRREGGVLDIHRLVVNTDHFRKGIARALVEHVEKNAATVDRIAVSTGTKNGPARHLYRSLGFEETREAEVAAGLRITFFKNPYPPATSRGFRQW
jgi:ribosomal protein S18 acetylase RimI-like enzyme